MKTLPLVVAAAILTLPLIAQRPGQRPGRGLSATALVTLIKKYDKNHDGKVERSEYPRGDRGFANLDKDKNGVIEEKDASTGRTSGRRRGGRSRNGDGDRPARPQPPKVGDVAPDFELPMLGMKGKKVKLSSFAGDRPVALIFGSYT